MQRRLPFVVAGLVAALLSLLGRGWWTARQGAGVGSPGASGAPSPRSAPDARTRAGRAALAGPVGDDEGVITGRVVRADNGAAVAGATVNANGTRDDATLTGLDGRFRLGGLRAGQWKPTARAKGLFGVATASTWVDVGHVSSDVIIALHPAAEIVARVELASSGELCPGASVDLRSRCGETFVETADDAGELRFTLPPGHYRVSLDCPGKAHGDEAPAIEVGDEPQSLTFVVHDKLAITGVVVDDAGQPVPALEIAASLPEGAEPATSFADEEGAFEVLVAEPGSYTLTASDWSGRADVAPVLTSAPGSGVRVVVHAPSRVEGRVVDRRGDGVRATVLATRAGEGRELSAGCDDDGRFELPVARPRRLHLEVDVAGARLPIVSGDADPIAPTARPITLVVAPPPRLVGTVLGANGPASRAEVSVSCPPDSARTDAAFTDDKGRFKVFMPAPGCIVSASSKRGESTEPTTFPPGVPATLRLRPGATLRGTIRPAPAVFAVRIWGRPGRQESFFGTSGAWEISGIGVGDIEVEVLADSWVGEANVTLSPGETKAIQIDMTPRPSEP